MSSCLPSTLAGEPVECHPELVESHPEPVESHPEPVEGNFRENAVKKDVFEKFRLTSSQTDTLHNFSSSDF